MARYRADLIETAWDVEKTYGALPTALDKGWGIVTAGITLPDPRYEWTPFYGVGVDDRNLLSYIQGRQIFEGAIGTVYLCHDASRLIIGDSLGQIFNVNPKLTDPSTTAAATTVLLTGGTAAGLAVASAGDTPKYIVAISQAVGTTVVPFTDTFAYIGAQTATDTFTVHHTMNTTASTDVGWQGKIGTAACQGSVHSITRAAATSTALYANGSTSGSTINNGVEASATASIASHIGIRETLKQNSFTLGSKINSDNGKALTSNFKGNKIGNIAFSFAENAPVSFNISFTGQDMAHNMSGGAATTILKYDTVRTPSMTKVTEQPYFFSKADIKFGSITFAKFRTLTLTVNNQLDPRFYINQSAQADNRQVLSEILEGRRAITFTGSVDMDDTGTGGSGNITGGAQAGPDIKMLQYLFNQGFNSDDPRDFGVISGISLEIELKRYSDATSTFDTFVIKLPATDALGANNPGLILNTARYGIPAPPQVHQNLEIDGLARSMRIEIKDSV